MRTQFDKIFVLSLITNKARQKFIKQQFNLLGLDFEFVYGIDYTVFEKDYYNREINFPVVLDANKDRFKIARDYGCALTHYTAVDYAYEFGYNNILIMEDDICFRKNLELIKYYLNNIPKDADFINFDTRFINYDNCQSLFDKLKNNDEKYIINDNSIWNIGGMMYGIMNRESMKLYLENQNKMLKLSDHVSGFWDEPEVKRYISKDCLCTDMFNVKNNFSLEKYNKSYTNIYNYLFKDLNSEMFFKCFDDNSFTRW